MTRLETLSAIPSASKFCLRLSRTLVAVNYILRIDSPFVQDFVVDPLVLVEVVGILQTFFHYFPRISQFWSYSEHQTLILIYFLKNPSYECKRRKSIKKLVSPWYLKGIFPLAQFFKTCTGEIYVTLLRQADPSVVFSLSNKISWRFLSLVFPRWSTWFAWITRFPLH